MPSQLQHRVWTKDEYFISTDPSLIPIATLNEAFATDVVYWATPLPEEVMRETLQNSLCFGLYERLTPAPAPAPAPPPLKFIGIARCVTDFTTFVYLTDVYTHPASQGRGLGTWLLTCVRERVDEMPHLRRSLLFTGDWKRSVPFYERLLGMEVLQGKSGEGLAVMTKKGRGHPDLVKEGS